jgi:hypothetical protein
MEMEAGALIPDLVSEIQDLVEEIRQGIAIRQSRTAATLA